MNAFAFADSQPFVQMQQAAQAQQIRPHPLIQEDLYFGRNIGNDDRVTEQQFQQFLKTVIAPFFPNGVTVYDARGQFLSNGSVIREPSKVVTIAHENTAQNQLAINTIVTAYQKQFQQQSVLQVENQDIAIGKGQGEDLIANDPTPELIQVDLYFGGRISDRSFNHFLESFITPRFPNGLTVYDAEGEFDQLNKVVSLILEDTEQNEQFLYQVVDAYEDQFQQASVLEVVNEAVTVGFGQGEDLIANDPTPQLIQVDLYFGRNIGSTDQVSQRQFRQFLRTEITPRFPDGLTVYDADGQFLNSTQQLIREPSKVVSLIMEDTVTNERSLNQIIDRYKQRFQQESVLTVVDETLNIAF